MDVSVTRFTTRCAVPSLRSITTHPVHRANDTIIPFNEPEGCYLTHNFSLVTACPPFRVRHPAALDGREGGALR